jgi:hypothetical protein
MEPKIGGKKPSFATGEKERYRGFDEKGKPVCYWCGFRCLAF